MFDAIEIGDYVVINGRDLCVVKRVEPVTPVGPALVVERAHIGGRVRTVWPDKLERADLPHHWRATVAPTGTEAGAYDALAEAMDARSELVEAIVEAREAREQGRA